MQLTTAAAGAKQVNQEGTWTRLERPLHEALQRTSTQSDEKYKQTLENSASGPKRGPPSTCSGSNCGAGREGWSAPGFPYRRGEHQVCWRRRKIQ